VDAGGAEGMETRETDRVEEDGGADGAEEVTGDLGGVEEFYVLEGGEEGGIGFVVDILNN